MVDEYPPPIPLEYHVFPVCVDDFHSGIAACHAVIAPFAAEPRKASSSFVHPPYPFGAVHALHSYPLLVVPHPTDPSPCPHVFHRVPQPPFPSSTYPYGQKLSPSHPPLIAIPGILGQISEKSHIPSLSESHHLVEQPESIG